MSEIGKKKKKCQSVFPKAQDDDLKRLVLSAAQNYPVYCHKSVKKKTILISENFDFYFIKKSLKPIYQLLNWLEINSIVYN